MIGHHADASGSSSHCLRVFPGRVCTPRSVFSWMKLAAFSCKLFLSISVPAWMGLLVNNMHAVRKGRTTMSARVITTQYQPEKLEEGQQIYREMLSAARQQPGFKGILGLVDRGTDKALSITLWETKPRHKPAGQAVPTFRRSLPNSPPSLPQHQ